MLDQVNLISAPPIFSPSLAITTAPHGSTFNYPVLGGPFTSSSTYYTPIGQQITFTGSATFYDADVIPVSWDWDFGDGITANGQSVLHRYTIVYPYPQVTLKVTDSRGLEWATRQTVYIQNVSIVVIQEGMPLMATGEASVFDTSDAHYVKPAHTATSNPAGASENRIPGL